MVTQVNVASGRPRVELRDWLHKELVTRVARLRRLAAIRNAYHNSKQRASRNQNKTTTGSTTSGLLASSGIPNLSGATRT